MACIVRRIRLNREIEDQRQQRIFERYQKLDRGRFGLGDIQDKVANLENITENDVTALASTIKRKNGATLEDIHRLSVAFLLNVENIVAFSKITGALKIIVKQLTGNDCVKRVVACECLCNFALGNDVCCEKLASTAGSYLILYLDNIHHRMAVTCAWTILNILLSDQTKSVDTLLAQGLVHGLVELGKSPASQPELIRECNCCLYILVSKHQNCLRPTDWKILESNISIYIDNQRAHSVGYMMELLYHALSALDFNVSEENCETIIRRCAQYLCDISDVKFPSDPEIEKMFIEVYSTARIMFIYPSLAMRIVANFIASESQGKFALEKFMDELALQERTLADIIYKILKIRPPYEKDLLWMAGNIYRTNQNYQEEIVNAIAAVRSE